LEKEGVPNPDKVIKNKPTDEDFSSYGDEDDDEELAKLAAAPGGTPPE
jgi:hypothetical protein